MSPPTLSPASSGPPDGLVPRRHRPHRPYLRLLGCLVLAALAFSGLQAFARDAGPPVKRGWVEISVRDVVPLEELDSHAVMLMTDDGTLLPIFVDESAAIAIAFRLAGRPTPHRQSEDVLRDTISAMGGQVIEVRIDEGTETLDGQVLVRQGGKTHTIATRPSDSIAMALSSGAKIWVTERLLDHVGLTREELEKLHEQLQPGYGGSGPTPPPPVEPLKPQPDGISL